MQNLVRRLTFEYLYFRQPPWDTGISPPELLEFIKEHEPGLAIDLGCGTGTNIITLARAGWRVTGVDFASRAIKIARRKLEKAGVQADLWVRDATNLHDIRGPFNFALDLGCFHGISGERREKYLVELYRILTPGGFWLLYAFLQPEMDPKARGLGEADLRLMSNRLSPLSRRDGYDNGRGRPSAWFLFQKQ